MIGKMGIWYEVPNPHRRNAEGEKYMAIKVEHENGTRKRWLMFTMREWEKLPMVLIYTPNTGGLKMKCGRLFACCKDGRNQYIMNTDHGGIMLITRSKLERAEARAIRNQAEKIEK